MPLKVLALSNEEKTALERLEKFDSDWRVRERAKTLLLLCAGDSCPQVAAKMKLHFRTISYTRKAWLDAKFESLPDRPRCGAPLKITPPQRTSIVAWAQAQPLSSAQLLARHLDAGGTPVHLKTMVNLLGRENFVWKRTRASFKKWNEGAFHAARAEISGLREQAAAGQIVLGYLDEAGFCAVHPNRSAWTPVGTQHLIPAIRGQRLNVLAALMSTGHLESTQFTGSMTSDTLIEFLHEIAEKYTTPVTLIIDNASVHRSKKVSAQMVLLEQKGVKLYFLPPYSPELNRIEKLWQQMKYVWMGVKCQTLELLNQDVSHILDNFGVNFKLAF